MEITHAERAVEIRTRAGRAIKERRIDLRLKQDDVAKMAGLPKKKIYRMEKGIEQTALSFYVIVAEALGMSLDAINTDPKPLTR